MKFPQVREISIKEKYYLSSAIKTYNIIIEYIKTYLCVMQSHNINMIQYKSLIYYVISKPIEAY